MIEVSMVVPVKDEEKSVQPLIDSICRQTRLPSEVIFVDGGSKDATRQIIRQNAERTPFKTVLIEAGNAYPGEGRNIGVNRSGYELIAFTDGGIRLDEKWLEELIRPLESDRNIDVVYGAYEPVIDSFIKECSLMAYISPREDVAGRVFRTNFIASSLFKKRICLEAGLFPPFRAAEDRIFMENIRKKGAGMAYTDKAVCYWQIPGDLKSVFRRFSEFSMHDLVAGRARDWHHSVIRTYGILLLLVLLGIFVNRLFFFAVPALLAIRLAHMFFKRRADFKIRYALDPRYLFAILFIMLLTDLALFYGTARYIFKDYKRDA